jgi:hypothetical protein
MLAVTLAVPGQRHTARMHNQQRGAATGQYLSSQGLALAHVAELRKESRLPGWANFTCYEDNKNMRSGWFMLIGWQPVINDLFFNDAKKAKEFGYARALTYQEYIASDAGDITAMNMPIPPEALAGETRKAMESGQISVRALQAINQQLTSERNAIAVAKMGWTIGAADPKDEETLALLDAPAGTNFHKFLDKYPGYLSLLLYRQKYYGAGIIDFPNDTLDREGNVIFETDFGSGEFETLDDEGRTSTKEKSVQRGIIVRIQMEETSSELRFLQSHSLNGSGIGIPVDGICDLIPKQGAPDMNQPSPQQVH